MGDGAEAHQPKIHPPPAQAAPTQPPSTKPPTQLTPSSPTQKPSSAEAPCGPTTHDPSTPTPVATSCTARAQHAHAHGHLLLTPACSFYQLLLQLLVGTNRARHLLTLLLRRFLTAPWPAVVAAVSLSLTAGTGPAATAAGTCACATPPLQLLPQQFTAQSSKHTDTPLPTSRQPVPLLPPAPVQEPVGDLVLLGVGHDCHQLLQLLSRQLASPAGQQRRHGTEMHRTDMQGGSCCNDFGCSLRNRLSCMLRSPFEAKNDPQQK
jgi:hypothetical protein